MIEFYVSDKHEVKCNACFIGRTGENEAEEIRVIVPDCVCDKWLYLDFEKPDGTKFKTPRIDIVDGIGSYMLGGSLVDNAGMLKVEAVLQDENGVVWKSERKEYYVSKSIDATEQIEKDNPDFIAQAQKVLDEIEGITNELDPTVPEHVKNITEADIEKWNSGTGGGLAEETDPTVPDYVKDIKESDIENWNNKADIKDMTNYIEEHKEELKGETGPQGEQGIQGEQGPQGIQGPKGEDGANGKDGKDGYTPVKGVDYFDGKDGINGKDGEQGPKGDKGDTGEQGPAGKDGANGKDGVSVTHSWNGTTLSITSASGTTSANLKGEKGDKGDKGDTGLQGEQGIQGIQGNKGDTGAKGDKGDKGDTGPQGEQGVQGIQGPKGDKGDKGDTGATGATGKAGADGYSPTITTSKSGKVTTITITDKNGTKTATVNDGTDGKDGIDASDDKTPPQYWIDAINDIKDNKGNITTKGFESTVREKQNMAGANCVQFVWFSDPHIYATHPRVLNICKVANYLCERCNIPLIAITGDLMSQDSPSSTVGVMNLFTAVQNVLNGAERERLMYIMGNHDGMWGTKVVNGTTVSYMKQLHHNEMYNILFREQATDFKRVFSEHGSYFYVDNIPQKVRFIMLDSHFDGDGSVDEEGYPIYNRMKTSCLGQEQLQWVSDIALDMPKDYTAVLMLHTPSPQDMSLLGEIITAYNSKTKYNNAGNPITITGDFWGANVEKSPYKSEIIDVDFTNAKGTIAAVFHGHIHKDSIDTTTLSVPLIGITTAGGDVRDTNAPTRTAGTATETAMDVVTINKKTKTIYMSRLGPGEDRDVSYGSDYRINTELMNVSSSNLSISAGKGNSYTTNLTANVGTITSVVVTMGANDITSEVYTQNADNKGGTITIPLITGDIVITAVAESGNPFEVTSSNWSCNSSSAGMTLDAENQTISFTKGNANGAFITCNNLFKRKDGQYSMSVTVNGSSVTNAGAIMVEAFDSAGNTITDKTCINFNNHGFTYNTSYKAFATNSGYIPQIFTLTEAVDRFRLKFAPGSPVAVGAVATFSNFDFTEPE